MQAALRLLDKEVMDKQRALDAALGQIERAFGKGSIMKLGSREAATEAEVISTGSLGLDIALGIGGLPRGRIIEIYGPESSGRPLSPCTSLPRDNEEVGPAHLSTQSMLSIRLTLASSGSMSTSY